VIELPFDLGATSQQGGFVTIQLALQLKHELLAFVVGVGRDAIAAIRQ
jgi:hypothetical protein